MAYSTRHIKQDALPRPSYFSRTSGRDVAMALALVLAASVAVLAAQFLSGAPMSPQFPLSMPDSMAVTVIAVAAVVGWCYSAVVRCSDSLVRRCLLAVGALLVIWLLDVLVKYPATDNRLIEFCWYLYYLPLVGIPLSVSLASMRTATLLRNGIERRMAMALSSISAMAILLVLTNALHHFVFDFDISGQDWQSVYSYEWGYWLVIGWVVCLAMFSLIMFFASARRNLRKTLMALLAIVLAIGTYIVAYILRAEWAFSSNIALSGSLLVVFLLEFCLDFGVLPSCFWQRETFLSLPLDMRILDKNLDPVFKTKISRPLSQGERALLAEAIAGLKASKTIALGDGMSCSLYPVDGGIALVLKDLSVITQKRLELAQRSEYLERQVDLLQHRHAVQGLLARQEREKELLLEVENSIFQAMDKARGLLAVDPGSEELRHEALLKVKLILSYCKRKGALVLDESKQAAPVKGKLDMVLGEAALDLREAGVDCAAMVMGDDCLSAASISTLYDCFYEFATLAFLCVNPAILFVVQPDAAGGVEMSCALSGRGVGRDYVRSSAQALSGAFQDRGVLSRVYAEDDSLRLVVAVGGNGGDA